MKIAISPRTDFIFVGLAEKPVLLFLHVAQEAKGTLSVASFTCEGSEEGGGGLGGNNPAATLHTEGIFDIALC